MFKLKKAIVTGGCGFLGSHLVKNLVKEGWNVRILDNLSRGRKEKIASIEDKVSLELIDLRHHDACRAAIKDVDVVFHFANVVSGITWHKGHSADLCVNFAINYNVFQACALNEIPKVLYVSSSCVYPTFIQTRECAPYLPENLATHIGAAPSGIYGWSKLTGEFMLKAHIDQYGMNAVIVRPFNVYGPQEDFSLDRGHVIPAIMRRVLKKQNPLEVWGSGDQSRGFTYVDDVIRGIMLAIEKCEDGTPINLGYPQKVTIRDVAGKIVKLAWEHTKYCTKIKFLPDMPEGDFSKGADITRAQELLGWTPKIDIDEGLKRTWEWAVNNIIP